MRMPPDGSAFAPVGPPLPDSVGAPAAAPAWDRHGRAWVTWRSATAQTWNVAVLSSSGAPAATWTVGGFFPPQLVTGEDGVVYARFGGDHWQLTDSGPQPVSLVPQVMDGELVAGIAGASFDGGQTSATDEPVVPVDGLAGAVLRRDAVYTRATAELWRPALSLPAGVTHVLSQGSALVAVADGSYLGNGLQSGQVYRHDGPLPAPVTPLGPLEPAAQAMLDRANRLRADASLPPLVGDPAISRASMNHSRYWTLNPLPRGLSAHAETPGTPGFTGVSPGDRCAAVGAVCGGEILYAGRGPGEAVNGWVATIYHRFMLMSPTARVVGAGYVDGGPSVMNANSDGEYWQAAPIGYPRGTYRADLSFSGERPDPVVECADAGQRITWPLGAAVTLFGRGDGPITVFPPGGRRLDGCQLDNTFIPDDPLRPGTVYRAVGSWGDLARRYEWTFKTAGKDRAKGGCRASVRILARRGALTRRGRLRFAYRTCGRGRLVVTIRRTSRTKPILRRVFTTHARRRRVALRLNRVPVGTWRVTARLTGRSKAGATRIVAIR
jgi:uncharacterized protein YkwD